MFHSVYGALCADPSGSAAAAAAAASILSEPNILQKDTTFTKIFVGGLPYHTTDKSLRDFFEPYGEIEEAVVITDRQTGKSKGYGFVTMRDRIGAERACKEPNPIIDGRKANVNLAYLGAKPRANVGMSLPMPTIQTAGGLPATLALPGRFGIPQVYYPSTALALASPVTASPIMQTSQVSSPGVPGPAAGGPTSTGVTFADYQAAAALAQQGLYAGQAQQLAATAYTTMGIFAANPYAGYHGAAHALAHPSLTASIYQAAVAAAANGPSSDSTRST
jgi:hypothetical protein